MGFESVTHLSCRSGIHWKHLMAWIRRTVEEMEGLDLVDINHWQPPPPPNWTNNVPYTPMNILDLHLRHDVFDIFSIHAWIPEFVSRYLQSSRPDEIYDLHQLAHGVNPGDMSEKLDRLSNVIFPVRRSTPDLKSLEHVIQLFDASLVTATKANKTVEYQHLQVGKDPACRMRLGTCLTVHSDTAESRQYFSDTLP